MERYFLSHEKINGKTNSWCHKYLKDAHGCLSWKEKLDRNLFFGRVSYLPIRLSVQLSEVSIKVEKLKVREVEESETPSCPTVPVSSCSSYWAQLCPLTVQASSSLSFPSHPALGTSDRRLQEGWGSASALLWSHWAGRPIIGRRNKEAGANRLKLACLPPCGASQLTHVELEPFAPRAFVCADQLVVLVLVRLRACVHRPTVSQPFPPTPASLRADMATLYNAPLLFYSIRDNASRGR